MKNLLCTKFSLPRQKALTSGCVCSHPNLFSAGSFKPKTLICSYWVRYPEWFHFLPREASRHLIAYIEPACNSDDLQRHC